MAMQIMWIAILSASILLHSTSAIMSKETEDDLEQKAMFFLNEFKRSLQDIRALHRNSDISVGIQPRSLNEEHAWKRLANHIFAFCEDIKETDNVSLTVTDETVHVLQDKDAVHLGTENYDGPLMEGDTARAILRYLPTLRPISVEAERMNNQVKFIFSILHYGDGAVARVKSFKFARVELATSPNVSRPYITRVQFVTDASSCQDNTFEFQEQYEFMEATCDGDLDTTTNIQLDVCGFDKYQNISLGVDDRKWETYEGVVKESVTFPMLRIITGKTGDFVLNPGHNETFIFEFHSNGHSYLKASAKIYDYVDEVWHRKVAIVVYDGIPYSQPQIYNMIRGVNNNMTTFSLEIVNQTHFKTPSVVKEEDDTQNLNLTLRLTLPVGDKQWSGMLSVDTYMTAPNYNVRSIVRKVKMDNNWHFTSPRNPYTPPAMKPILAAHDTLCTMKDNKITPGNDRNCTVSCSAFGQGITNISVSRHNVNNTDFTLRRSVSYVLGNKAFAMIDVGPASFENDEKNFICSLEYNFGSTQKEIILHTIVRPTVLDKESHVIQLDNETSEVQCRARGLRPMSIAVEIATKDGHAKTLDHTGQDSAVHNISFSGKTMTLSHHLPTSLLRYPNEILTCKATNRHGDASKTFMLADIVPSYRGTNIL